MNNIVTLPKPLQARLARASQTHGISPDELARQAISEHLRYLAWKERAIAAGEADIAAGRVLDTNTVFAAVEKQRARRAVKAQKAA